MTFFDSDLFMDLVFIALIIAWVNLFLAHRAYWKAKHPEWRWWF